MGLDDFARNGLLNADAPGFGEVATKRHVYIGVCNGVTYKQKGVKITGEPKLQACRCFFKTKDKSIDQCPKCGYFIKWIKTERTTCGS